MDTIETTAVVLALAFMRDCRWWLLLYHTNIYVSKIMKKISRKRTWGKKNQKARSQGSGRESNSKVLP
jgi:hypothetical protein